MSRKLWEDPAAMLAGVADIEHIDSAKFLDFLWNNAAIGLAIVGDDDRWLRVNPTLQEWLGYGPAELLRLRWSDVTVRDDVEADLSAIADIKAGRLDRYVMRKTYVRRDHTPLPAVLTVIPIRSKNGNVACFLSQISRVDPSRATVDAAAAADHRAVVWDFAVRNKKWLLICALTLIFGGRVLTDGFAEAAKYAAGHLSGVIGGGAERGSTGE